MLDIRNLRVTLDTPQGPAEALRGIDLSLPAGATAGLIGESGCGKSMLALAIMGLLPHGARVSGSVRFKGQELVGATEASLCRLRGNRVAMVFQEPMTALNPLQRVGDQVAEPLRVHQGASRATARAEAQRLLDRVRLPQASRCLQAYPHQLSGGQRQRVTIAMALACQPDLLIADEPTTALDVTTQQEILSLIRELVQDSAMALLLVSHDLDAMSDAVAEVRVMYAGQIIESGPREAVYARRAHPYTGGLFAARPHWAAGPDPGPRRRLPTIPGRVPELTDRLSGCAFANRCAWSIDVCTQAAPPVVALGGAHTARCHRLLEPGFQA